MALPDFTMRQLLEAGSHFGHQSHRWNPTGALMDLPRGET
jgi:ribosomal protein S2